MSLRTNALLLVLLAALAAVAGDWTGDETLRRAWMAPIGLLLLGLSYERLVAQRAKVSLQVESPEAWLLCRAGELRYILHSRLRRRLELELAPAAPPEFALERGIVSLSIPADGPGRLQLAATARRLGAFDWPAQRAWMQGVLGLASWKQRLPVQLRLRVLPDLVRSGERAIESLDAGARPASRPGAGGEILQLRDYRPGDAPRAIDWKATGRTGRLISRDFAEDQHLDIIIAVDVGRSSSLAAGGSDRLALYVNVAARLAQRAAALDDRIGLLLYADAPLAAVAPGRGTAAVHRVRSVLATARPVPAEANPSLAALRIRALARQRSLVLMLTDPDDAGAAGALLAAVRLLRPKHFPFIASVTSEAASALARRPAEDEVGAFQAIAAQRYCAGIEHSVSALRALGAPCVLARPELLDSAALGAYLGFRRARRV